MFPGLLVNASDGRRTVVWIAPAPNFTLVDRQSIHPQLQPAFKVMWSGWLQIPEEADYAFHGQARIRVDGKEARAEPIHLLAGWRSLQIEFERQPGPARFQLVWQSNPLKSEPVPCTAFGHEEAPQQFVTDGQIEKGRLLLEELNCLACHRSSSAMVAKWRGPSLNGTAARAYRPWLFRWLENPQRFRTNVAMPVLLQTSQDRADVAAYLGGASEAKPSPASVEGARLSRGKELCDTIGCAACHNATNWPLTGLGSKLSAPALAQYLYDPLAVDPSGRMPGLALTHDEALVMADYLTQSRDEDFEKPPAPGDARRGQMLVVASGCLNCHALEDGGKLESGLTASALDQLDPARGCLAERPAGKAARYRLSLAERRSLAAFLQRPDLSEAPVQDFQLKVARFQCEACHSLYGEAKVAFERPPPPLTESGQKLRASWLEQVLAGRKRIRPWLTLRMPDFGEQNMRPLVPGFAAQAGAEPGEGQVLPRGTPAQVQAGVKLIGRSEGGLSCINCHDFRGTTARAETRGPDMMEMRDRLRADWVRRWWRDPARHVPRTPMPAFFSEMPPAVAEQLMDKLLFALGAGPEMPNPIGLTNPSKIGNPP